MTREHPKKPDRWRMTAREGYDIVCVTCQVCPGLYEPLPFRRNRILPVVAPETVPVV